jgi:hypothetical protein
VSEVPFVCVHDAERSQPAGSATVRSAPADVQLMADIGPDIAREFPAELTPAHGNQ